MRLTWALTHRHTHITSLCYALCVNTGTLCLITVVWSQFQLKSPQSQWRLSPLIGFLTTQVNKRPVLLLSTQEATNKGDLNCWGQAVYVTIILQPKTWECLFISLYALRSLNSWWKVVSVALRYTQCIEGFHIQTNVSQDCHKTSMTALSISLNGYRRP